MISVIVPIYNEVANISELTSRLELTFENNNISNFEIILVDDGSKDDSASILKNLSLENSHIKFIILSRNFGQQIALMAGIDKSNGDFVAIIDADMQDPPELLPAMLQKAKEGFDVVYGKRKNRPGESKLKKITAKWFYRIISKVANFEIPVDTGDFRVISRKVVHILKQMPEQQKFLRGQIAWVGLKQTFIEYDRAERKDGETGYSYSKMIKLALDGITSFSNFPLRLVTLMGFFFAGVAGVLIIYALISKFYSEQYVQGWFSLMISVLFIGGIQLISVGILGEYISRIFQNVSKRPLYVIDESNITD